MVKRWFTFIGKEILGLHEAAYLLAIFAFGSQLLALVRDKLLAFTFGAGHSLDIYYAAFRIPDFIFISVGSLVSASILLPYFIDSFAKGQEQGRKFSDSMFTVFFVMIITVSVIVFIFAPYIVPFIFPGFAQDPLLNDLILSMRIMLFSPFFLGLSNLYSSLTQMKHRFLVYAASPVLYNFGIIIGTVFLYPYIGIPGLALGVAVGALMHVGLQIPFLLNERLIPRFTFNIDWNHIKRIIYTSIPRTVTLSANQAASFVLISLASVMAQGSISVYALAINIQAVPMTIIGASYSSAVFPTLSRLYFEKNAKEFLEKMIVSARHIIFWSMPVMVLFIVLRAQIVRVILGAGKFDWADTRLTAAMVAIFTVSTIGQSLIILFVRAFYAEGKTKKPLLINIISASVIIILGIVFGLLFKSHPVFQYFLENLFKVDGQKGTLVLTLALAYSCGVLLNLVLHWWTFEKSYAGFSKPVFQTLFHSFSASVICGFVTFESLRLFGLFLPLEKVWGLFLQGLGSGLFGLIVGIIVLYFMKNLELQEVWRTLHHKIWGVPVPPAEVEHM